jgi:hypothetical protein
VASGAGSAPRSLTDWSMIPVIAPRTKSGSPASNSPESMPFLIKPAVSACSSARSSDCTLISGI